MILIPTRNDMEVFFVIGVGGGLRVGLVAASPIAAGLGARCLQVA